MRAGILSQNFLDNYLKTNKHTQGGIFVVNTNEILILVEAKFRGRLCEKF